MFSDGFIFTRKPERPPMPTPSLLGPLLLRHSQHHSHSISSCSACQPACLSVWRHLGFIKDVCVCESRIQHTVCPLFGAGGGGSNSSRHHPTTPSQAPSHPLAEDSLSGLRLCVIPPPSIPTLGQQKKSHHCILSQCDWSHCLPTHTHTHTHH